MFDSLNDIRGEGYSGMIYRRHGNVFGLGRQRKLVTRDSSGSRQSFCLDTPAPTSAVSPVGPSPALSTSVGACLWWKMFAVGLWLLLRW